LPEGFFGFGSGIFVFESDFYLNNPGIALMGENNVATSFGGGATSSFTSTNSNEDSISSGKM
jgi:hypothetical protein